MMLATEDLMVKDASALSIQVSGLNCFEGRQWRAAICYYLEGVWQDRRNVTYRPKISFEEVTLRLDPEAKRYYAYGRTTSSKPPIPKEEGRVLRVGCKQMDVEGALIRFVKNRDLRVLVIQLDEGELRFVKGSARSDLTIWASSDVPRSMGAMVALLA